jgi:hypothetical protein
MAHLWGLGGYIWTSARTHRLLETSRDAGFGSSGTTVFGGSNNNTSTGLFGGTSTGGFGNSGGMSTTLCCARMFSARFRVSPIRDPLYMFPFPSRLPAFELHRLP